MMIEKFGIGVDISSIEKFTKKPYEKNKSFYKKIFSNKEIEYCIKFKNQHERFAGKFALKEATIKSINKKIHFSEIETFHVNSKPKIKILNSKINYQFISTLSHESGFVVAFVISEKIK
tara:strand:- start:8089 stop:8445 length:357 start_codon:yes stop_codon:yes gene_type:complete